MDKFRNVHDSSLFLTNGGDDIYEVAKRDGGCCIDGGAAAGFVTKVLLKDSQCKILAFEPFPGNVPHFRSNVGEDPRVSFYQKALGSVTGSGNFYVSRVVDGNQPGWNRLQGYSSEGHLVSNDYESKVGKSFKVDVVRLEDYIDEEVTLLKLDLQGGEYEALAGLGPKSRLIKYCYVEFSLDWRILDYFSIREFVIFDTQYTGVPKVPVDTLQGLFDDMNVINLSNGHKAVSGVIRGVPRDLQGYREFIEAFKGKYFHHLWTDLIAVSQKHLRGFFCSALS